MPKKRAFISVDSDVWEGCQRICKELKISNIIFNEFFNYYLGKQYVILKELEELHKSGEQVTWLTYAKRAGASIGDDQLELI